MVGMFPLHCFPQGGHIMILLFIPFFVAGHYFFEYSADVYSSVYSRCI